MVLLEEDVIPSIKKVSTKKNETLSVGSSLDKTPHKLEQKEIINL